MIIGFFMMVHIVIDVMSRKEIDGDIYFSQFAAAVIELLTFDAILFILATTA